MAQAAEDAVWWARLQIWVGVLGFVAVLVTLIFTGQTAKAASSQAQAAQDTLTKIQRPYIFIFGVRDIRAGFNENFDGHVPYTVANYGQTPAIIERMEARISRGQTPEEPGQETDDHSLVVSPIFDVQERREDLELNSTFWLRGKVPIIHLSSDGKKDRRSYAADVVEGQELFVWIRIGYRGPITSGHETSACWRYDREPCQFIQYGGAKYNYGR